MEECVVYGFIRDIGETLNPYIYLHHQCLFTIFYEYDCFVKSGEAMNINKDGTKVTNIDPDYEQTGASCYGALIIAGMANRCSLFIVGGLRYMGRQILDYLKSNDKY